MPDTLEVAQWNVSWRKCGEWLHKQPCNVSGALTTSSDSCTLHALADLIPIKTPRGNHAIERFGDLPEITSCWVTGLGLEPQSASVPSSRIFYISHCSPPCSQDGGLSRWAVPEMSPSTCSFVENNDKYLGNCTYTLCIPLTTSFTKFVLLCLCFCFLFFPLLAYSDMNSTNERTSFAQKNSMDGSQIQNTSKGTLTT